MAYVTVAQLRQRMGDAIYTRLTDRVNGTIADTAVAQQLVSEAEGLADSYLSKRYATPVDLSAHPELASALAGRVLDLVEFLAWQASPFVSDVPERVRLKYVETREWFEALARGEVHLPAQSPPAGRTTENDAPRFRGTSRSFTHEELDGL